MGMLQRVFGVAALLTSAVVVAAHTAPAAPSMPRPAVVALPAPTGADSIGVVDLHGIDPSRADPWMPGRRRELMISIWYPATDSATHPAEPWITPDVVRGDAKGLAAYGIPATGWSTAPSAGHLDAPADISHGPRPVLLYSPGFGAPRSWGTAQVEDLASHGFVVVTIDHPGDAGAVTFPDGRVEQRQAQLSSNVTDAYAYIGKVLLPIRVADTRFVLDELADIVAGHDPDVDRHPLPGDLARMLDLSKVAMFGHSLGGATALQVLHDDRRVLAGLDLDGTLFGSVVADGVNRPAALFGSQNHDRSNDPSWQQFWDADRDGPKLDMQLGDSQHNSFTDLQCIMPQLVADGLVSAAARVQVVGTIDPRHSIDLQRGYLRDFFDILFHRYADLAQPPDN